MVETREREVVYATDSDAGPSTALVFLFSLLIIAVLGFMVYFFSNNDLRNMNNPQTIIERDTQTTVPVPMPTPVPSAPAPEIHITPPASTGSGAPLGGDTGTGPSTPGNGQTTTP